MKSYLKFLSRNKLYTAIEFIGLAVSLAFVILIGSYVVQQYKVAWENPDRERIYVPGLPGSPGLTYGFPEVVTEIPEIEEVATLCFVAPISGTHEILYGAAVNRTFFDMMPCFHFVEGSADVLASKSNVILSKTYAYRNNLSLGDRLILDETAYTVGAVYENPDGKVFQDYEVFLPVENFRDRWDPFDNFGSTLCFLKVQPGTDRQALYDKLEAVCKKVYPIYGQIFFDQLDLL